MWRQPDEIHQYGTDIQRTMKRNTAANGSMMRRPKSPPRTRRSADLNQNDDLDVAIGCTHRLHGRVFLDVLGRDVDRLSDQH